jgi:hypothetical protein
MGITAHWIKASPGPKKTVYTLQADLIGFHRIPGRHTGEHLAHTFLHIIDRINIANRVSLSIISVVNLIYLFSDRLDNSGQRY